MSLELDVFNPANFAKHNLVKELLESKVTSGLKAKGDVTYKQCDDDFGVFSFDKADTKNTPTEVVKGCNLGFTLAGIVSDEIEVKDLHVHVLWNGNTLYDEDHNQDTKYDSSYSYNLHWSVPSFAPSGHYST